MAIPTPLGTAVYDVANRVTTWDGQAFTWDPAGNLTTDGTSTYTWNARGQLTEVTRGTSTWTHSYDGTGRRIGIDDGTNLSQHLYDGANPRLKYVDGNPITSLLGGLGLDTHHARTTSGTTTSYLTDHLGSTVSLATSIGTTTNYTYTPFGQPVVAGDPAGNDLAFTGRPLDPSGLYQLRARYYHPGLQRFISEDPIGLLSGSLNAYQYGYNNPISFTDRLGLAPCSGDDRPILCDIADFVTALAAKFAGAFAINRGSKVGPGYALIDQSSQMVDDLGNPVLRSDLERVPYWRSTPGRAGGGGFITGAVGQFTNDLLNGGFTPSQVAARSITSGLVGGAGAMIGFHAYAWVAAAHPGVWAWAAGILVAGAATYFARKYFFPMLN